MRTYDPASCVSSWRLLLVATSGCLAGCGQTTIAEHHIFQARDAADHRAYYRVSVEAKAKLAKTSFSAGLFDAAAVDALFGTTSADDHASVDESLERRRRDAVDSLAKAYYDALAAGRPSDTPLANLEKAITPIPRDQKFVIIYSANASVVEEAIASFSEEKDTRDAILSLIAPFKRDEYMRAKADGDALDRVVKMLCG